MPEVVPVSWKPTPITRSADHRYTYEGVTYPGVSNILEPVGASFNAASGYGAKHAALAAVRLAPELPKMITELGEEGARMALSSKSSWGPDPSGSKLGTEVHDVISRYLIGDPVGEMSPPARVRLDHFDKWWQRSGWTLRLSEAMVVNPGTPVTTGGIELAGVYTGWGGTLDLLAYDQDRQTVLADLKTGNLYPKAVLQVAGYGMAKLVQPAGADQVFPLPVPDRYVILHVTGEGVREVPVVVGMMERMAFLACLDLHHWNESMKGKKL